MEWQHLLEKEKMRLEQKHSDVIKELHTEIAELRIENKNFKDKQSFLDSNRSEQARRLQHLEQELALTERELSQMKKQNSKLDIEYHDKDKNMNSLKTRVAVLEQELKDKSILISKHTEMLKTVKEQKQQLEDLLNEKENQLLGKQSTLKNMSNDLMKANEIISKLQNELVSTKSKVKLRTGIALEQERLLNDKDKAFSQMELKLTSLEKEVQDTKKEHDSSKEQIKVLQLQIEDKNQTIKKNEDGMNFFNSKINLKIVYNKLTCFSISVISFLNRRVNEHHIPMQSSAALSSNQPIQLTLPAKFLPSRFEPSPTNPSQKQPSPAINLQANRTSRTGLSDGMPSLSNFNKSGKISTSTPLERMNALNSKLPKSASINTPVIVNDQHFPSGEKAKFGNCAFQGGLRRANIDKPPLPSAYFPNSRP